MSLIWGIFSSFPLANHFDLPGSQFIFGISQDSSMCAHASLSQDGFYHIWVEHPLALLPIWPTRSLSVYGWCRRSSDFRNEKCLGRARPLVIVVLLFLFLEKSTRNESPIALPWGSPSTSCHSLNIKVKMAQSCPTLCDPMNYTVHGILQARILEWVAFPFSRGLSQPRNRTQVSIIADRFFPS